MRAISDYYSATIGSLDEGRDFGPGLVPMLSCVTGDTITSENQGIAEYWSRNLTSPVEFEKGFSALLAHVQSEERATRGLQVTQVLEVGPLAPS